MKHRVLLAASLFVLASTAALGAPTLSAIFGSSMVLQRDTPIPVWGTAQPGERVTVEFAGQSVATNAGEDGRWRVVLERVRKRSKGSRLTVRGRGAAIHLRDILVGEVWIASGQSNMQWTVSASLDGSKERRAATHPSIRLFTVKRRPAHDPKRSLQGTWARCSPDSVRSFSAVAYYFGRELRKSLGVPIGIIHTSWGGTRVEAWTPPGSAARVLEEGEPTAAEERKPPGPNAASALYNGMISPLIPYAFRGVIWYQGESNANQAASYADQFPAMITSWRELWGRGDFPFLFVQLANFKARIDDPNVRSPWAELREAQRLTMKRVASTGMAVAIDIGEAKNIHPKNKQEVGRRLALWALSRTYGDEKIVPSGPLPTEVEVRGDAIVVRFEHVAGKLRSRHASRLRGFTIAGADGKYVVAKARIEGDTVVVSHRDVPKPVAVRYAWADNPVADLENDEGLPASPFRTDD